MLFDARAQRVKLLQLVVFPPHLAVYPSELSSAVRNSDRVLLHILDDICDAYPLHR